MTVKARQPDRQNFSLLIQREICAIQILPCFDDYRYRLVDF